MTRSTMEATLRGDRCELRVTGDVDATSAERINELATLALDLPRTRVVVLDLSQVSFVDTSRVRCLLRIRTAAAERHKILDLREPSRPIPAAMGGAGLHSVLP